MMTYWTDLYLMHDVDDLVLAGAVASALGVDRHAVAVAPYGTPEAAAAGSRAGVTVLVQRDDLRRHGHPAGWPHELAIGLDAPAPDPELDAIRAIAKGIGVPLMVNIEEDGQDRFRIVFPNGDAVPRLVDDNDEPMLTEADRRRLAIYDRLHTIAG
jgi:hypothetical protein